MNPNDLCTKADLIALEERLVRLLDALSKQEATPQKEWINTKELKVLFSVYSATTRKRLEAKLRPATLAGKNLYHYPTISAMLKKEAGIK